MIRLRFGVGSRCAWCGDRRFKTAYIRLSVLWASRRSRKCRGADLRAVVRLRSVPRLLTALSICFLPDRGQHCNGPGDTEPELEDVLKALGASKFDILWNVGLPATMPVLLASLKVAVSYASSGRCFRRRRIETAASAT